ncbi:hypothetical protein ABMA27_016697 [Loxostege sticticalis]|uniref:Uncharacterized protein n=1 Tax=Loxostege sticticalis TaxID=481309 RepID=A0ABR3I3C6_LOXSC
MRVELILLLALCALTTAMVTKDKRASSTKANSAEGKVRVCQRTTPCAWSMYKPHIRIIDQVINNTYCICSADTKCVITEDDTTVNTYVHRCRPPGSPDDISGTR